jgi:hypothetical protein
MNFVVKYLPFEFHKEGRLVITELVTITLIVSQIGTITFFGAHLVLDFVSIGPSFKDLPELAVALNTVF